MRMSTEDVKVTAFHGKEQARAEIVIDNKIV
jgi:hypothetical protein